MASGSFDIQVGNRSSSANEYIRVYWSATPDTANNRSLVTVSANMYRPWQLYSTARKNIWLWINGVQFTASRSGWGGRGWTGTFISGSAYVPHNSDGSKSIYIRLLTDIKGSFNSYINQVDTGNRLIKLDNLARKSSFSINKSAASLGDTLGITLNRSSSSVRHAISIKAGNYAETILSRAADNGSTKNFSHVLKPDKILPYMGGRSVTATVTVATYNGSTSLGSTSKTFTLSLRGDIDKPSIPAGGSNDGFKIEAVPIAPNASTSHYIQGKTQARITITPVITAGSAGAIKTYRISVNGVAQNYTTNVVTTGVLDKPGENTISASVVDGRGTASDEVTKTINVLAYNAPMLSAFSTVRCLADGTLDKSGEYVKLSFNYKFADCGGNNNITIALSQRNAVDSNEYAEKKSWEINASAGSEGVVSEVLGTYSIDSSFDFKLGITDSYGASGESYSEIGTEELLVDLSPDSVAVGKVAERHKAFEVFWDSYFDGTIHGTVQTATSDIRRKELVDDDVMDLLPIWDDLSVTLFRYKNDSDKIQAGLVAQDVMRIFESHGLDWQKYGAVYEDPVTGFYSLNYGFINQLTLAKMQVMKTNMEKLEERVAALELNAKSYNPWDW